MTTLLAVYGIGLLIVALGNDAWGEVSAAPPRAQHEVLGSFGPWQARLEVRFLTDPALPWKRVPRPVHIPWIPLRLFAQGPAAVRGFQDQMSSLAGRPGARDMEIILVPSQKTARAERRDWLALTTRKNHKTGLKWDWTNFLPVAAVAETGTYAALASLSCGVLAEVVASIFLSYSPVPRLGPRAVFKVAAVLYLGAAASALIAFVWYVGGYHNWFKTFASDFLFAATSEDVVVWPADMEVQLAGGAVALCGAGLLALISGLTLVTHSFDPNAAFRRRTRLAADGPLMSRLFKRRRVARRSSLLTEPTLREHNAKLVAMVATWMLIFLLFCGVVAFFLGRQAVEQGVSQAFRGPESNYKQTVGAIQTAGHLVYQSVAGVGGLVGGALHRATHPFSRAAAVAT